MAIELKLSDRAQARFAFTLYDIYFLISSLIFLTEGYYFAILSGFH